VADQTVIRALTEQCAALRDGLGRDRGLMIDVNFAFRPASLRRIVGALAAANPSWLEADVHHPAGLASVRRAGTIPLASLETLHGRRAYRPYLVARSVDVAIVDVPWNGLQEALRIAALAETFEVNVAPHNFYGPLADLMTAQFCALASNVAIMEIEADDVPWKTSLLTQAPQIADGRLLIPQTAGWGAEPNEEAIAAHPWAGGRAG